jgi:hypothetical protein
VSSSVYIHKSAVDVKASKVELQENFNWSPNQLQSMIKEIDKIWSEEGLLEMQTTNIDRQGHGINDNELVSD